MMTSGKYVDRSIKFFDLASGIGLLAIFIGNLLLIVNKSPFIWVDIVADDAYYYLGVARNLVDHGVSSFLPPFETNGYQPLWLALLSVSAFIFGTSSRSMVVQLYSLSFFFTFLFCLASRLRYKVVFPAVVCASCFPFVMVYGMETTMIPCLLILYLGTRKWWGQGIIGSLIFMARLDALSLIIAKDLLDIVKRRDIELKKYLIIFPLIALYMGINIHYFDTPVPVSGLAKSVGNVRGENITVILFYFSMISYLIPALICIAFYTFITKEIKRFQYADEIIISSMALLICMVYYTINSGWPIWPWYCWPQLLLTYYLILEAVFIIRSNAARRSIISVRWIALPLAMLFLLSKPAFELFFRGSISLYQSFENRHILNSFGRQNVRLVDYLRTRNIKPGSFFAMGDRAGSFGFFLGNNYRFIHTEGLAGPYSYYRAMQADEGRKFIENLGVDYLVVDRERLIVRENIIGVIEPVMPLSARFGDYILCFKEDGVILDQSYNNMTRYLLDFKARVECPRDVEEEFLTLRKQYGGVVKYSFPMLNFEPDLMAGLWRLLF
ncbi:hypothetical protein [Paraburkholderia saeva]|uniref:hypothetical protein n=1 Tax=Paraburkholderia saeva TaxID=2777537 RepID=UPI001D62216D|nr:hypothetical protein [Paraburkholderia saeva]CAG4887120.1 hypothetical protein R70241_00339 [Paraburkholderia saeva]